MAIRYKCPVCGSLAWASTLDRSFSLETYNQKSLGKAHGFKPILVNDLSLVARVKAKILSLYNHLFPAIKVSLLPLSSAALNSHVGVAIKPTFIVKPMVTTNLMEVSAYV